MKTTIIHFKDNMQDFLWWKLDENGKVIDCGPFQKSIWVGYKVLMHDKLKVGIHPEFLDKEGRPGRLIHQIIKIEDGR